MEVKDIHIKGIPNEEFKDNEYLENYVQELRDNGVPVVVGKLDDLINFTSERTAVLLISSRCTV